MKNLYDNFHTFRKINQLALHHHKARVRKKNLKRLKRNYERFSFLTVMTKIFGVKLPKKKKEHSMILKLISRRKLIDINVLPSSRMSNSLDTPIDVTLKRLESKGDI